MSPLLRTGLPAAFALLAVVLAALAVWMYRSQHWRRERRVILRDEHLRTGTLKPVRLADIVRADWSTEQALVLKDRSGRIVARIRGDTPDFFGQVTRVFDALARFVPVGPWPMRIASSIRDGSVLMIGDRFIEKLGPAEHEERWLVSAVEGIALLIGERHFTPTKGLVRTPSLDIALAMRDHTRAVLTQQPFPLLEVWAALRKVVPAAASSPRPA